MAWAVAGPTPGSASSCSRVAVLRSSGPSAPPPTSSAGAVAPRARRVGTKELGHCLPGDAGVDRGKATQTLEGSGCPVQRHPPRPPLGLDLEGDAAVGGPVPVAAQAPAQVRADVPPQEAGHAEPAPPL